MTAVAFLEEENETLRQVPVHVAQVLVENETLQKGAKCLYRAVGSWRQGSLEVLQILLLTLIAGHLFLPRVARPLIKYQLSIAKLWVVLLYFLM